MSAVKSHSVLRQVEMRDLRAEVQSTSLGYRAGGAIYMYQSNITVHNSIFKNNSGMWGGAIAIKDCASALIIRCIFVGNSVFHATSKAAHGGAIVAVDTQAVQISDSEFVENTGFSGGALLVRLRDHLSVACVRSFHPVPAVC